LFVRYIPLLAKNRNLLLHSAEQLAVQSPKCFSRGVMVFDDKDAKSHHPAPPQPPGIAVPGDDLVGWLERSWTRALLEKPAQGREFG
jgi:hypothetical protein